MIAATDGRTALLAGASGLVGGHVLAALLEDSDYRSVTVLARRTIRLEHPKLRVHVVNFDRPAEYRTLAMGGDVFSCLGTTIRNAGSQEAFRRVDFTYPVSIAEAALSNGAGQILMVSALGADPAARVFYSRVKGEVEQAVAGMGFRAVHIFRPSLLKGQRAEFRPMERIALAALAPLAFLLTGPLQRYRPVEARAVASCMVAIAKREMTGVHVFESVAITACSRAASSHEAVR